MELRNRSLESHLPGGYVYAYENHSDVLSTYEYAETVKHCMDFHRKVRRADGTLPPSDLEAETLTCSPFFINKSLGVFCFSAKFTDGVVASIPGRGGLYAERDNPERGVQNAYYTQQLLERTNPFRSEFSVPVFIRELLDLPGLFKLAASTFAGIVGSGYLNYKFGWAQFNRDIKTLASITKTLESRLKEFESLRLKGGLRRTVRLQHLTSTNSQDDVPLSTVYGVSVYGSRQNFQILDVWGSCRWRPTEDYSRSLERLSNFNLAMDSVFDITDIDAETLWQMSPFTWLADYFEDISGFLAANSGRAFVEPYDICIMRRHVSKDQYQVTWINDDRANVSGSGYHIRDTKARDVTQRGNFPALPIEILNESQWKNVLALFLSFAKAK